MSLQQIPDTSTAPAFQQLQNAYLAGIKKSAIHDFFEIFQQLTPPFQDLLSQIFAQPGVWEAFAQGPSSQNGHHCSHGGNLVHSVEVARLSLCITAAAFQNLVDRDVLIVAALLHDLGKVLEYEVRCYGTEMSPLGRLVGHKFSGFGMMWGPLHSIPGIAECQRLAILNCLANSGSPGAKDTRGPACFEAQIVSRADQLSASGDLFRASQVTSKTEAGFGVRHEHQRETPYHVKRCPALCAPTPPTKPRPSRQERLKAATKVSQHYFSTSRRA